MAQRTTDELKVFLEGTLAQYNELTDKTGTVFFDKTNHAVYAKGECIIQSNIKDVTYNSGTTVLTIIPFTGSQIDINLGIQDELDNLKTTLETWAGDRFVRYDVNNQNLSDVEKANARTNIGAVKAEEGKGLSTNDFTNGDKAKLDGIDDNAQTNREVTVNGNTIGLDSDENQSAIKISGNLVTAPNNGEDSKIEFNLSHKYVANDKKIYFFNSATAPATGTTGAIFSIDTTDFVKDGMLANATYNESTHTLTLIFNATATDSGVENIEVDLSTLVDVYKAGTGLTLADGTFNFNYGAGLTIDESNQEVTVDVGDGLQFGTNRKITLKIANNGGITVDANGAAVDWTKAPVQKVNNVTPDTNGNVTIDVTPKVWKFED